MAIFVFMDLPGEVRNNIYDKIGENGVKFVIPSRGHANIVNPHPLAFTSKAIRPEFLGRLEKVVPKHYTVIISDLNFKRLIRVLRRHPDLDKGRRIGLQIYLSMSKYTLLSDRSLASNTLATWIQFTKDHKFRTRYVVRSLPPLGTRGAVLNGMDEIARKSCSQARAVMFTPAARKLEAVKIRDAFHSTFRWVGGRLVWFPDREAEEQPGAPQHWSWHAIDGAYNARYS